jgi:DNA modification methylase
MEWLIRIYTPENGLVLDPFMGSGTTGVAAANVKRQFVGIDTDQHYVEIAKKRLGQVEDIAA